jgi:hypothetical protein
MGNASLNPHRAGGQDFVDMGHECTYMKLDMTVG